MLLLKLTSSLQGCSGRGPAAPRPAQDQQLESKGDKNHLQLTPKDAFAEKPILPEISPTGPLHAANLLFPEKIAVWLGVEVGFGEGPREAVTKLPLLFLQNSSHVSLVLCCLPTHFLFGVVSLSVTRLSSGHRPSCGSRSRGKKGECIDLLQPSFAALFHPVSDTEAAAYLV